MKIAIKTSLKEYPVHIGASAIEVLTNKLQQSDYTKILVITDEHVAKLHLETLLSAIPSTKEAQVYTVPAGEQAKQMKVFEACHTFALEQGLDRKSCIIAFGGGAVGDLAGFVAASYMRGISFIQVPTTILAHDSAVGGKTAINHTLGKNMIGAFHQPDAVIYHTEFLKTLPDAEIRSGFAEVVKHALIADREFLNYLMTNISSLQHIEDEQLIYMLRKGIEIKAHVVSVDEKEHGLRAVLNLGHTLGHAIEASSGYRKITHGESVIIGIIYALHLSKEIKGLSFAMEDFISWLKNLNYTVDIPSTLQFHEALAIMTRDKKAVAAKPRFILLEEIAKPILHEVDETILEKTFNYMKK